MTANLVEQLLIKMKEQRRRVVVIGDTILDRWVHGHVAPCQDGCAKFIQESVVETPGGAANAERCLSNWPNNRALYGYAMNDCPVKYRYVEGGKIMFRADDDGSPDRAEDYKWARDLAHEMVHTAGAVLLSDYDKGFLTPEFIRTVAAMCRQRGIPCVADAKRAPEVYAGCILKGNKLWHSQEKVCASNLVMTNGSTPPTVWQDGEVQDASSMFKLRRVECINHVGAGDCFSAHLALALAYGFSLKDAAALAHSAGRVYVQHPHNRPPTPAEIAADLLTST